MDIMIYDDGSQEGQQWALWSHNLWWLEGSAAQAQGASNCQKKSEAPHKHNSLLVQYTSEL
jgi:hypothetical protein